MDGNASDDDKPSVPFMLPMFSSMSGGPSSQPMYLPTATDFENFFSLFCERVDPIVRILHKPTVKRLVEKVKLASLPNTKKQTKPTKVSAVQLFMPEKWPHRFESTQPKEDACTPVEYALLMTVAYSATCSMMEDDPRISRWFGETHSGLRKKITLTTVI